ncbi:Lsr2 family protein [uncultured Mobiluncus sp.]|uniref:histone-like nucleoid-structuring protein Lsr2 n=1 Tax=uncultured Mobiluncus sp. TaxID=293425 RepID=UPI00262BFC34|nr:Lsr2 family protein [uncultured Mobiluncus sp.]
MAKKVKTILIDDIDGSDAAETVTFGLDNVNYEIDLNETHAKELRDSLARWIKAGRKVSGRRRRGTATPVNNEVRELNRRVRAWAGEKGIPVNDRGRVPQQLIDQYRAATGDN